MTQRRRQRSDPRAPATKTPPVWRWRTLPVWMALTGGFCAGWYVAAFGADSVTNEKTWSWVSLYVVLALSSFGLSRVMTRYTTGFMLRRRARGPEEKRILPNPAAREVKDPKKGGFPRPGDPRAEKRILPSLDNKAEPGNVAEEPSRRKGTRPR